MTNWWPGFLGGATFLSSFASSDEGEAPLWDFKNNWVRLSLECTEMIDSLLADTRYGQIRHKIIQNGNIIKPNKGTHYYYLNSKLDRSFFPCKYINLIKKKETVPSSSSSQNQGTQNQENFYYIACFSNFNKDVFDKFLERLFATNEHEVKAIHIDTSGYDIKSILVTRFAGICKPKQQQAITWIREHFLNPENKKNTKVVISGPRGVGKTYTSGLLKKAIEGEFPGYVRQCFVQLYVDFNPMSLGLDVQTQVLSKAKPYSPVILVINEVDVCYQEVFKNKSNRDGRTAHTQNKTNFNNMLDDIANAPNVITIFTTEKSKAELDGVNSNPENTNEPITYKSFYRKGRVDFFIEMSHDNGDTPGTSKKITTVNEV